MKKNTLAVCVIVLVILVIFGGCTSMMQNLESEDVREYAETMLDALIADDFQTAYALVSRVCTESDFCRSSGKCSIIWGIRIRMS